MRAAIALLFILCCFIKSFTLSATARLSAAACTSSCKRCFFRKLSKLLPRCLFLFLAAFDVGIFSSQSQSSVLLWRFLCLLDESMQQDDFAFVHEKQCSCDPCRQFAANFPDAGPQVIDQRHAKWPPKLHSHNILANSLSFVFR